MSKVMSDSTSRYRATSSMEELMELKKKTSIRESRIHIEGLKDVSKLLVVIQVMKKLNKIKLDAQDH